MKTIWQACAVVGLAGLVLSGGASASGGASGGERSGGQSAAKEHGGEHGAVDKGAAKGAISAPAARPRRGDAPTDPESLRLQAEAGTFLEFYTGIWLSMVRSVNEAEWAASTDATPVNEGRRTGAEQAMAAFTGNAHVVRTARRLLAARAQLADIQVRQLEVVLRVAAQNPGTIPAVVDLRIAEESRAAALLDGYQFCLRRKEGPQKDGEPACAEPTTANTIDDLLLDSPDLTARLRAWEASKEIGPTLRPSLETLQKLRNQIARELGYTSFFHLQVDEYGMTVPEMMALLGSISKDIAPLYNDLHTWSTRQLAARYRQPAPTGLTPAHWFPNRWAQEWSGMVTAADLDPYFADKSPEWIVQQAESFYVSMGFPSLDPEFWARSDLYPVPAGDPRRKNAHASAWHMDLGRDVRSLMTVEPDAYWFFTSHHELGHVYYYLAYANADVPPLLREGANRAFHEAIGELASLAAGQIPYLKSQGFLPKKAKINQTQALLVDALERTVTFLPWSIGVMSNFEYELYEKDLPPDQWQRRWWELVAEHQKIAPPADRDRPDLCDACTKTHIIDDPGAYYDYAIATVIKFQLHDHIARKILKQDPRNCNYYGNPQVGAWLQQIMAQGATRDWRDVLRDATGEDLSTRAMIAYYEPLAKWLKAQNTGERY